MSLALKWVKHSHTVYDVMKQSHVYKYRNFSPDSFIRVLVGLSQWAWFITANFSSDDATFASDLGSESTAFCGFVWWWTRHHSLTWVRMGRSEGFVCLFTFGFLFSAGLNTFLWNQLKSDVNYLRTRTVFLPLLFYVSIPNTKDKAMVLSTHSIPPAYI